MEDDDDVDGVLPAYIEEDEEEAMDAKQQRRQQSIKPRKMMPWELATPEEKAKEEVRRALEDELYEHGPKTGSGSYTRLWFLDLTVFDLDEETRYGPMRYMIEFGYHG
ncbi:uncharacterized protein LOC100823626 [Brachypodium distachyon]|uniref:uncharacterized protein LOC100823626 n=1 Tax=Brachypodium distachyon TaxID=15368 RepID=UPI00052FEF97|nr:uncharacterized protein LOC100823626 [Brachypodium distachyon]|eukprot:XP_010233771.1 uncharacterized protein LOC100823626 [Brachypodium distachyon]